MEFVGLLVVVGAVALVAFGLFGSTKASIDTGQHFKDVFCLVWGKEYGSMPPDDLVRAMTSAAVAISTHSTGQNVAYGRQKLQDCIKSCAVAVLGNEDKMSICLGCLLSLCATPEGKTKRGCEWAADTILAGFAAFCPSAAASVFSRC